MRRIGQAVLIAGLGALGACDYVAQKELRVGESTRADVERLMGKPKMIWEEDDGRVFMEYPRAPAGQETWMVELGPDGRYRGMKNLLTEENFARVKPGMSRDDVRRLLGEPTMRTTFERREEVVWSWRYEAPGNRASFFNVHLSYDGRVRSVDVTPDPERIQGG